MYSLDLKTVDKVVYQRENSSVQVKVVHDELAEIQSLPAGSVSAVWCRSSFSITHSLLMLCSLSKENYSK